MAAGAGFVVPRTTACCFLLCLVSIFAISFPANYCVYDGLFCYFYFMCFSYLASSLPLSVLSPIVFFLFLVDVFCEVAKSLYCWQVHYSLSDRLPSDSRPCNWSWYASCDLSLYCFVISSSDAVFVVRKSSIIRTGAVSVAIFVPMLLAASLKAMISPIPTDDPLYSVIRLSVCLSVWHTRAPC